MAVPDIVPSVKDGEDTPQLVNLGGESMGRWEWVDFANVYPRASSSSRPAAPNSAYHAVIFGDDGRNVAQDSDSQARKQRR